VSPDLRTRKKLATHKALAAAARELIMERGLDGVTVDEIAEAAGVSPRTFFNYFACKEEAVVGIDPTVAGMLAGSVARRPHDEHPLEVLLAVLGTGDDSELVHRWMTRFELVHRHPELLPRYLAFVVGIERTLVEAIGHRLDLDPNTDPYPKLVVAVAVAALRSTIEWWHSGGHPGRLQDALRARFDDLAAGLPVPPPNPGGTT